MNKLIRYFTIVSITICFANIKSAQASNYDKKDTLYYLVDLNKVPVNDRMISRDTEGVYHFYQINCQCSNSNDNPRFICDEMTSVIITKKDILRIHFITLPLLIETIKKHTYLQFWNQVVLYFVEPNNKKFNKFKVHLIEKHKPETVYKYISRPTFTASYNILSHKIDQQVSCQIIAHNL